jgi:hypothetical protein
MVEATDRAASGKELPFSYSADGRAVPVGWSAWPLLVSLGFTAGYAAVIYYFYRVDVYDDHFFDAAYSPVYNIARIIFGLYLFTLLYVTGDDVIRLYQRRSQTSPRLAFGERIVVCFFAGAIAWQFFMLALGYLSLYTRFIAFAVTIPLIMRSSLRVIPFFADARYSFGALLRSYSPLSRALVIGLLTALLIVAFLLLAVKGLYPAGGHDYFTHYFYYYVTVLKNHGIWPNDVWYHYFYSKGEGIIFLSMLLTDPLAPSVVTYCFVAVATLALFIFIDRIMPGTLWPWAATLCFLSLLIYGGNVSAGGGLPMLNNNYWAEFPKEHEINAAFVIAIAWFCERALRADDGERRLFLYLAAGCAFAVSYLEQPTPLFVGLFTLIIATILLLLRRYKQSIEFVLLACAAGVGFVSNLIINYLTTGIPSDVLTNMFWPIVNLHKIEALGWLYPVIKQSRDLAAFESRYWNDIGDLPRYLGGHLHLILVQPWFGYVQGAFFSFGLATILCVYRKGVPACMRSSIVVVFAMFFAFLIAAATLGVGLAASFYRYASFIVPFEFAAGAMVWMVISALSGADWTRRLVSTAIPVVAAVLVLNQVWQLAGGHLMPIIRDGMRFLSGRYSIYDAYIQQAEWPGRMPYGAIYPGSLKVWNEVGRGTRVWSFHIHSYCMLPDCRWETDRSFTMSPHMFEILFGPPDRARDILKREGLNYFLLSRELGIQDVRAGVGLFGPDTIGDYLGVKWTDGTTYLLTWLGPGVERLSADWLLNYRQQVSESPNPFVYQGNQSVYRAPFFQQIYDRLKADPAWGRELPLPWLK